MKNKILALAVVLSLSGCAELQQVASQYPGIGQTLGNADIAMGLKEALNNGVTKQVTKLTVSDGFYKNAAVKILLPPELQKVDKTLRDLGLSSLADEGLKVLNRAAEDAVKEAVPVFVTAIKSMTITDAKNILMGNDNAATIYLQRTTSSQLYGKFNPIVKKSLSKVGADKTWNQILTKYNTLPLVTKVNPDLNDYVTNEALKGVFTMVAVEEKDIRNNVAARTSDLLKRVFGMQ
ncbi:DUF4197 domain-containing protein [Flavobacterium ardleyense]|uniref:DUF4197 domain-containing protein n=1 Tax=Flavobacterium ardleyense TaxID=2038737 RepID=UPI00298C4224|nr:DUF4197 domain-containing protein [Flavobacterium ardleyense]